MLSTLRLMQMNFFIIMQALPKTAFKYHRIIEWPGFKKDHNDHLQPPWYVQGCQPPDQAALRHIQPWNIGSTAENGEAFYK